MDIMEYIMVGLVMCALLAMDFLQIWLYRTIADKHIKFEFFENALKENRDITYYLRVILSGVVYYGGIQLMAYQYDTQLLMHQSMLALVGIFMLILLFNFLIFGYLKLNHKRFEGGVSISPIVSFDLSLLLCLLLLFAMIVVKLMIPSAEIFPFYLALQQYTILTFILRGHYKRHHGVSGCET